jgi:hypothetical protein
MDAKHVSRDIRVILWMLGADEYIHPPPPHRFVLDLGAGR